MQSIQLFFLIQPTSQKRRDIHCAFAAAVLSMTGSTPFSCWALNAPVKLATRKWYPFSLLSIYNEAVTQY